MTLASALGTNEAFSGFSRLNVAMVLTDARQDNNPIVYVNDAFEVTTGYSSAVALGRNCRFLQGPDTDKRDVDRIRHAIEAGREVSVDILNYRANGAAFMNRVIIAPILGDDGTPVFFLGIQKELLESDRAGDNRITQENLRVVQNLVHRDLAMILGALREPSHAANGELGRQVRALPRRLGTLQLVYEDLRHAARQSNGGKSDLGGLLTRVAASVAHDVGRAGLRFVQNVEGVHVALDRATRIALIVSETLHNAFEHAFGMDDEGRIELRMTRLTGGGVRIMISDDGQGLPAQVEWPSDLYAGGRIVRDLLQGLDATLNVVRGAAGTVVLIDVPVGMDDRAKD